MKLHEECYQSLKWIFLDGTRHVGRWIVLSALFLLIAALIFISEYFAENHVLIEILYVTVALFVCFFFQGVALKICRREDPSLAGVDKCIIEGFFGFFIFFIYGIIPFIFFMVICGKAVFQAVSHVANMQAVSYFNPVVLLKEFITALAPVFSSPWVILAIIVTVFFGFLIIPALINFSRSGKFRKAFAFGEIFGMIKALGWGTYILSWVVLFIASILAGIVLLLVCALLVLIPVVGVFLVLLIVALFVPILIFWKYHYFAYLL